MRRRLRHLHVAKVKVNVKIKREKHRIISLMSHVTKLVLRIVINRIRRRTLHEIAPEQYGVMPDKRTGNAIFVLRNLWKGLLRNRKMSMFVSLTTVWRLIGETQVVGWTYCNHWLLIRQNSGC